MTRRAGIRTVMMLKGLATEDFDLIAKNSQAMSLLCEDEIWMVLPTPEYRERSTEFRRSVDAVTEAAKKNKNLRTLPAVGSRLVRGDLHLHGWVYKIESGEVFAYDVGNGQFVKLAEYHPQIEPSLRRRTTHII